VAQVVPEEPEEGGGSSWPIVAGGAIAAALALVAVAWLVLGRGVALEPESLFSRMLRWGRAGGVAGGAHMTPREYARRVGRRYPDLARDATHIVDVYEEQRYGGHAPERGRLRQAADALRNVQRAVIRRFVRFGR
jgi:hypothetical protein